MVQGYIEVNGVNGGGGSVDDLLARCNVEGEGGTVDSASYPPFLRIFNQRLI
jgi:hypothetical protein